MIDNDEIRKEVAIKHGVVLGEKDPLLILVTMFENVSGKLLEQNVSVLNEQHEEGVKKLLSALQQGNAEAKKTAERVITSAADYVSEQVHIAVTSAMDEGRESIRKDLMLAFDRVEQSRKAAMNWAIVSGICAVLTAGMIWFA